MQSLQRLSTPLATLLTALLMAGCVSSAGIAPHAQRYDVQALLPQTEARVTVGDDWWKGLEDERLNGLMDHALAANPNLAAVRVRIEQASAEADAADAARKPRVDGSAEVKRKRYSSQAALSPVIAGQTANSGSLLVTGSWEIDAFGRQRSALDAAVGRERASEADYQAARVLLASNIVRQYVQLARLDDQRSVLERSLAQREEILGLTRIRVSNGLDTAVELRQGEGAVPEIRAQIHAIDAQRARARHALAALSGQGPDALSDWSPKLAQVRLLPMPEAIPADLLGRRADITAARWRIEAATKDLQSAKAEFYPSINLVAFAGFTSIGLDQLVQAGSREIGIGPAVRLPIFDAGRLRARYRSKAADVDGAVETYNVAILDAMRETADALSSLQEIEGQQREQAQALASATSAYDLALERYRGGLGSYLTVLTAETNVLAQRSADTDLKAQALDSQALLAHALGGGYLPG